MLHGTWKDYIVTGIIETAASTLDGVPTVPVEVVMTTQESDTIHKGAAEVSLRHGK